MRKSHSSNDGFSLAEVLLAVGTIAVGMLFIAGVFPVGIHFNTIASERTIAAIVADEAFAKIRLCAVGDPNIPFDDIDLTTLVVDQLRDYTQAAGINPAEFAYPSDPNMSFDDKHFFWSALCRRADPDPSSRLVQVTVFVSRKVGSGTMYQGIPGPGNWPVPVPVGVIAVTAPDTLQIDQPLFINGGYTIVDNQTGQIYRVLERDAMVPDRIILDRPWQGRILPGLVWVVPPPVGGGRYPCIAVYQRVIRF